MSSYSSSSPSKPRPLVRRCCRPDITDNLRRFQCYCRLRMPLSAVPRVLRPLAPDRDPHRPPGRCAPGHLLGLLGSLH